jgi:hypothetical protein
MKRIQSLFLQFSSHGMAGISRSHSIILVDFCPEQ